VDLLEKLKEVKKSQIFFSTVRSDISYIVQNCSFDVFFFAYLKYNILSASCQHSNQKMCSLFLNFLFMLFRNMRKVGINAPKNKTNFQFAELRDNQNDIEILNFRPCSEFWRVEFSQAPASGPQFGPNVQFLL
jgi:hypothetical protein